MAHTCQSSGFHTERFGVQRAKRQEKTGFWRFLGRKPPHLQIIKKSSLTAATHTQMTHACQMSGFYTERFGVQRANRQEKTGFLRFLGRKVPNFPITKKISLNGSNPHKKGTYMPNFIFLHRAVWCRACEQTGKKRVFEGFWSAKRPIFELRKNHS